MQTPNAGGAASVVSMTTPSPLPHLSANTPNTSLAMASLQALPESHLVLVVLDHPVVRQKWSSVVVPLLDAVCKKFTTVYPGTRLLIGTVVYRATADQSLLRPMWTLERTRLSTGSKVLSQLKDGNAWLGHSSYSATTWPSVDSSDLLSPTSSQITPSAFALEAFVAALELLEPPATSLIYNPLTPKASPVLARHLIHICLDSNSISVDTTTPPLFNANSHTDQLSSSAIGTKLAELSTSMTTCAVKHASGSSSPSLTAILALHKAISEPGKLQNEDLAGLLPEAIRSKMFNDANIIVSGLINPLSGTGGVKRGRSDSNDPATPLKRTKSGSISMHFNRTPPSNPLGSVSSADLTMPKNLKLDPTISTKIMFLRQQQEIMFKNWTIAYASVVKSDASAPSPSSKAPGMNRTYLEQVKNQLWAQQQALKMLVHRVISGAETSPNFNVCLQSLINIDKEAKEMGVLLGGPGGGQTTANRPNRSGSMGQSQQPVSISAAPASQPLLKPSPLLQQQQTTNAALPALQTTNVAIQNTAAGATGAAPLSPTKPKPFWKGAITWSVISDPATKQKRDIATLVSATSNSSSLEKLMSPWPEKLQITAITQLAPRNLQIYAQTQGAPYILFGIQGVQDSNVAITQATAERNAQMYASLAGSLDAKKSCAFIRHGSTPGAGIVLFATTQPTSSAERNAKPGSVPPKLIGVVLKDPIPFTKLLAAQTATEAPAAKPSAIQQAAAPAPALIPQQFQQVPQVQPTLNIPNYSMPLPQQQPMQTAAPSMALGSSLPFNLLGQMGTNTGQAGGVAPNYANLGNMMGSGTNTTEPNFSALAQMLGINNTSNNNAQAPASFMQQQQPATNMFNNHNANLFGNGANLGAQPAPPPTSNSSAPMTMEQLRALGFIQ